jgi:hypothetical protein
MSASLTPYRRLQLRLLALSHVPSCSNTILLIFKAEISLIGRRATRKCNMLVSSNAVCAQRTFCKRVLACVIVNQKRLLSFLRALKAIDLSEATIQS